jgi:nucleotide-binding universal stress UspA family protein
LVVEHGDPALRIVELAQERDCELIVMGKHGQSRLEKFFLGSVTHHVLSQCQGDLLVSV